MGAINNAPLIVIVGPTASGKTALAIDMAKRFNGEIVCADSRTIYNGMDIGTAKPTSEEVKGVSHWGLDLVNPDEKYSAARFKQYAVDKIRDIRERGRVPFLVGGTGLYVDGVIFDYQFGNVADERRRKKLESRSVEELIEYCIKNNVNLPVNYKNKRHLVRAIELKGQNKQRKEEIIDNCYVVGISTNKENIHARIVARSEIMFTAGVVSESLRLSKIYGWGVESMKGNLYTILADLVSGKINEAEAKEMFVRSDMKLVKKQLTWFKRNEHIKWLDTAEASKYISSVLK